MQTLMPAAVPRRVRSQRITGFLFAGLLQVALVWALVEGLDIKVWPQPPDVYTQIRIIKEKLPPLPPPKPMSNWRQPDNPVADKPVIDIDRGTGGNPITPNDHPFHGSVVDLPPVGIMATHSTPPYPALAARLGEMGSVELRLVISPQGIVTDAVVVRSSGHDDLDQAARAWVMGHWRYRPAMRGGVAVPAVAEALVRFDLRNGG